MVSGKYLLFAIFFSFLPVLAHGQTTVENRSAKNRTEFGTGVSAGNLHTDLINNNKVVSAEFIVWGMAARRNWLVRTDMLLDGELSLTGYLLAGNLHVNSIGPVRCGLFLDYSERNPRYLLDYGMVQIEEGDAKRLAKAGLAFGAGAFNDNYFRLNLIAGYGTAGKRTKIFVGDKVINDQANDLYHNYLYKDEMILAGIGLSGQYNLRMLAFGGSVEYSQNVNKSTTILPRSSVIAEGSVSHKIFGKVYISAGGLYSDNPLGLHGSSRVHVGTAVRF